jgi:hypothetical protein
MQLIVFVSGHLDLTAEEFEQHYVPRLDEALKKEAVFVVGDARGADTRAQNWLKDRGAQAVVFHMFEQPRNNAGFTCKGGYKSDADRDAAMTVASDADVAWVRPGREKSGTARNLARRQNKFSE